MQYNDISRKGYGSTVKRTLTMNEIDSYIDVCLIDEYADKDFNEGYQLDVDSLSEHERSNFLDLLMKHDTTVRDLVLYNMQKLINERLPECELKDRNRAGIKLIRMSNGDTRFESNGSYYDE